VVDVWTYIAFTWDRPGQALKCFIDGSEETPTKISDDTIVAASYTDHRIDIGNEGGNFRARGIFLSHAIWNVELTPLAIAATYNGNGGGGFDLNFDQGNYVNSDDLVHWHRHGLQASPNIFLDRATGTASSPITLDTTNITNTEIQSADVPPGGQPITITLPSAASNNGRNITIQDLVGNALGTAIIVAAGGSDTIEGSATNLIDTSKGSKTYTSDGGVQWRVGGTNAVQTNAISTADTSISATLVTDLIFCTEGNITITLPPASSAGVGALVYIKDRDGNATASNITVAGDSSDTIDLSATAIMDANFQSLTLVSDGATNWSVL
jgi:hypothetical protein